MKRMLRISALAALLCLGSSAAFAQGYVGAAYGVTKLDTDCSGTVSCDDRDTGWKLFGGFMFTPNFGAELGYYDMGKATATVPITGGGTLNGEIKGTAWALYAVGVLPLSDMFNVFAKLGVERFESKVSLWSPVYGSNVSETQTSPAYGLGAEFKFDRNFGITGEWELLEAKYSGRSAKTSLWSLGLKYSF